MARQIVTPLPFGLHHRRHRWGTRCPYDADD